MKTHDLKILLSKKLQEISQQPVSHEEIAIERNAELMDEIQRTSERELAMAALTRTWALKTLVKSALDRIASGEYGSCRECEEPISERRLQAIPWAEHCIRCQEKLEMATHDRPLAEAA
jgi:DnaK suppressor protein